MNHFQMPEAILGWFYIPGGDRSTLVQIRNAFVQQYGLDPNSTPVVSLDLWREEPFQLDLGSVDVLARLVSSSKFLDQSTDSQILPAASCSLILTLTMMSNIYDMM